MKFTISIFLRKIIVFGRFYRKNAYLDPQNVGENDPQNVGELDSHWSGQMDHVTLLGHNTSVSSEIRSKFSDFGMLW